MGYYKYRCVNDSGRILKGIVSADSEEMASAELKELNLTPIALTLVKKMRERKIKTKDFLTFVTDMHTLMQAGLPIYEALITLEEKYRSGRLYLLYAHLAQKVKSGDSLSQAFDQYDANFDPVYMTMLEAGEESGSLERCFKALEVLIERRQSMSSKLIASLLYPLFLTGFCLLISFVMFFYLIPTMKELLLERDLNGLTRLVISISDFLVGNQVIVLLSVITVVLTFSVFFSRAGGKMLLQKLGMRLPLFSLLLKTASLSRFCLVLSVLLKGGIDFVRALDLSKNVMKNVYFERVIARAKEGIIQGRKLSEELKKDPFIPSLFIRVTQVGEESGEMAMMMEKLGNIYEKELSKTLHSLIALIQPLLLVILGIIVAIILLSILLPLSDMNVAM
ncbi:hypothetical protein COB21_02740 [Candidatus Aerophobetes bacterium]|uniref:Type II secretion system protein GspF domain-containing protein n=1 Tax=Aerophobetes bacterium TaxID=2030807 RepID=A0A2A4X4P6_UNCAE|nr:MAG: hypothetical protein COB21_02740 [Candidatus Aerophobetes bacterium]